VSLQDENIAQPGESSIVCYYPSKPDLLVTRKNPKTKGIFNKVPGYVQGSTFGPERTLAEEFMDQGDIQPGFICADNEFVLLVFYFIYILSIKIFDGIFSIPIRFGKPLRL
jgi:hypothetical protein